MLITLLEQYYPNGGPWNAGVWQGKNKGKVPVLN
jgi:hypothetical protein